MDNNNLKPSDNKNKKQTPKMSTYKRGNFGWLLLAALFLIGLMIMQQWQNVENLRWDEFKSYLEKGYIEKVEVQEAQLVGLFSASGIEAIGEAKKKSFAVNFRPDIMREEVSKLLDASGVQVEYARQRTWLLNLFSMLFPVLILVAMFYFLFMRNVKGGAGGMLMSFGRSKHRLQNKDKLSVTFEDVAGIQEAKDEVSELVEFLKNPKKFQRLGGRIPRGVLLIGPPGCGKTLLAKAIAGEAKVPFFSISGSDFVEMFVGVGASRVRDLFKQAKENSPCIIFLDEIDAIGRKRGAGFAGGGHDEREQTLNAILVEMDGFDTNDQVIVIAATNRSDILDTALTRPGRFDRQVVVPLPDIKGRLEILKVHAKKVKMAENANLEVVARGTPMFSGADLAAILNEAALSATMANKESVETADMEEARDKVRWGRAKRSRVIDLKEKKVTAYHEAGHTLVQSLLEDADPLHKVSIIPRGPMGGATFALPERDRTMFTRRYCIALIKVCFGGRIAEEMFCDDISSGAVSDIQQATRISRQMVTAWGMSDKLGPIMYVGESGDAEASYYMAPEREYSERTAEMIDNEIKRIIDEAYQSTKELIKSKNVVLEAIAKSLLKYETLSADDVKIILDGGELTKPTVADLLAVEQAKNGSDDADTKQEENQQEVSSEDDSDDDKENSPGGDQKNPKN